MKKGVEVTIETARLGMSIPLHEGAEKKYYREKGIK